MIRLEPQIFVNDRSGNMRSNIHFFINVICFFAGIFLIFPGDFTDSAVVMASETTTEPKVRYAEKFTFRCHGIRFSDGVMIDLSLSSDGKWRLHLSHRRFKSENSVGTEIRLYSGRRTVKYKMFPYKRIGQDLFVELGRDEKYVTRLVVKGWLGYRIGVQNKVKRVRIPDARRIVREIKKYCSKE